MTVKDKKNEITGGGSYIEGSLIVKAADDFGIVLKWLEENADPSNGTSDRKERFVELDPTEAKTISAYDDRTAVSTTNINNPT